jgi:serine/threonine protein kinase/predicted XRE-type DNA-binding protein
MPAVHYPVGQYAHESERNAIRYLVDNLPSHYTVWSNPWLTERNGAIYELDAVVAAPHAVYVVEIKGYHGKVEGNENDWYLDGDTPIRSPLRLNRLTAQKLKDSLRRDSVLAGSVWVEGLVFLSRATDFIPIGQAVKGRVHLKATICAELQNPRSFRERSPVGATAPVDHHVVTSLAKVLQGTTAARPRIGRSVREYLIESTLDRNERYSEHLCRHKITERHAVLRVYDIDRNTAEDEVARAEARFRWEGAVLARVASHPHVLHADAPFVDEPGYCLPLEYFKGVTLGTWIDKYKDKLNGRPGLRARVALWHKIAGAIAHAHQQGVVHRMLRPEAVVVEDKASDPDLRVQGFALAKQIGAGHTLTVSSLTDERLQWSAPEVIDSFSAAEFASDQFGLGLLLGWLLANRPLFSSTREFVRDRGVATRVRTVSPFVPQSLDDAVQRMLALRPSDRFPTLDEAIVAVHRAVDGSPPAVAPNEPFDPENILPGTRVSNDYEVREKLGQGGLATVYAALHLVSGVVRALKVARPDQAAEAALRGEYDTICALDHRSIVKAIDLSSLVHQRLSIVMERVRGTTLSRWLADTAEPEAPTLRRYAEDLFGALGYLEEKGITHKDLKPDNLIVGEDGLTVIDFSLAASDPDARVGTALYRDPTMTAWDHAADRYAAALCLFELYTARHAFDGHAPEPEREALLDDVEPEGLLGFFKRALSPRREHRPPSALAMRHAFLEGLGQRATAATPEGIDDSAVWGSARALSATGLPGSTVALLRRAGIITQGELVAAGAEKLKAFPGLGKKKRREVLAVLDTLKKHNVGDAPAGVRPPLWPSLVGDDSPLAALGLTEGLYDILARKGYLTVGAIAKATRHELSDLPGVNVQRITTITEALQQHEARRNERQRPSSFRVLWGQLAGSLEGRQAEVLERLLGIQTAMLTQVEAAHVVGIGQGEISSLSRKALGKLAVDPALKDLVDAVERSVASHGRIATVAEIHEDLRAVLPESDTAELDALLRLLEKVGAGRFATIRRPSPTGTAGNQGVLFHRLRDDLVVDPRFSAPVIEVFLDTVFSSAQWRYPDAPPRDAETLRRDLRVAFPDFQDGDPIALACRITDCVRGTADGLLFEHPIDPAQVVWYVTRFTRRPMAIADLWRRGADLFCDDEGAPAFTPLPLDELARLFHDKITDCRIDGDQLVDPPSHSHELADADSDELPVELRSDQRTPQQLVATMLRGAAVRRGYRLLVAPPKHHVEIARSVARALGSEANFVSFEALLLERMEPEFATYERAERFKPQRSRLTRAAVALYEELLAKYGRPGSRTVIGDLAILGLCDATHILRLLYDETQTGARGFWAVVVPGVIYERQPRFNEGTALFHMDGTVLPVTAEVA